MSFENKLNRVEVHSILFSLFFYAIEFSGERDIQRGFYENRFLEDKPHASYRFEA